MTEPRRSGSPARRLRAWPLGGVFAALVALSGCDHARAAEARAFRAECDAGDAEACFEYGQRLYRGDFVLEDRAEAATRWESACDGGEARACVRLARLREDAAEGAGIPGDIEGLLRAGCDGGEMSGCVQLAEQFLSGAQASELLERACDGGASDGCVRLGDILSGAVGGDGPVDLERAASLFQSACGDDPRGCIRLAEAHLEGAGVDQAPEEAVSLMAQACQTSPEGCFRLAEMYREGVVVELDLDRALTLFESSCYGRTSSDARGESVAEGCYAHGELLAEGDGVDRNLRVAARSFERACRLGYEEACRR